MAIEENKDYVFCEAATYIGNVGIGKGCLIGTQQFILGLPMVIHEHEWNRYVIKKTYTLAGLSPPEAIRTIVSAEETTLNGFEDVLNNIGTTSKGAVFVDLSQQKRLKVRAGLFTKGVYWSEREKGPGWQGYGLGGKPIAIHWVEFYRNHPLAV